MHIHYTKTNNTTQLITQHNILMHIHYTKTNNTTQLITQHN